MKRVRLAERLRAMERLRARAKEMEPRWEKPPSDLQVPEWHDVLRKHNRRIEGGPSSREWAQDIRLARIRFYIRERMRRNRRLGDDVSKSLIGRIVGEMLIQAVPG